MPQKFDDESERPSPLTLTEIADGMYMAANIYEGADDFFSVDASAAYEYDDGRSDAYPLDHAYARRV